MIEIISDLERLKFEIERNCLPLVVTISAMIATIICGLITHNINFYNLLLQSILFISCIIIVYYLGRLSRESKANKVKRTAFGAIAILTMAAYVMLQMMLIFEYAGFWD